jgi:hypothetical protein
MLNSKNEQPGVLATLRALEFWLLMMIAISAGAGVSVWVLMGLGTSGLLISSLPKYVALWPRAGAVGAERLFFAALAVSIATSVATCAAAILLGWLSDWLWFGGA